MAGFLQARRAVPAAAGKKVAVLNDVQKKKKEMEKAKAEVAMKNIQKKIEDSRARRAAQLEQKKLKVQELRKHRVCVMKKTMQEKKKMEKPFKMKAPQIEENPPKIEAAAKTEAPKEAAEIKLGFKKGFFDEYKPLELITKGSFGSVYKAGIINNANQSPLVAAVKVFWKSLITEQAVKYIQKEVDVMTALNGHPNLVKLYGAYEDEKCIYIAMEFLEGGSLQDALNLRGGICDEMETKRWMQQIVVALEALHTERIAHRDIKLENIMLDSKGDVKLIDFGLSDYVFQGEKLSKMAGSPGYIAPEVFDKKGGIASDMWSLGVLAHVLLTGEFPFPDPQDPSDPQNSSDLNAWRPDMSKGPDFSDSAVWGSVSDEVADFVRLLLDPEPFLRMTAPQAKAHEWFSKDAYGRSGYLSRDQHSSSDLSLSCAF